MNYFFRQIDTAQTAEEAAEAYKTNEQLVKVLEAVDATAVLIVKGSGGMYICPFCHIGSDHAMRIQHQEGCIVLVARQIMYDADIKTEHDRWEEQLKSQSVDSAEKN